MISILQTEDPLGFWANTQQLTFFGSPNFGNMLLDGGVSIRGVNKSLLIEKIKKDVPSMKSRLRDIILKDNPSSGLIDIDFIYREKV